MSNLLEKASILLTPTAYDDGKILSVKPVQSLSDELITNGDFATNSNWTLTQATISNGAATFTTTDGSFSGIRQNVFTIGKTYLISLEVSNLIGTAEVNTNAVVSIGLDITSNGVKSFYMKAENTDIEIKRKFGQTNVSATIDNVSVKEVLDADFDFTRNSSATRVNSQGLIEDMQILSGDLVSNGDFSQQGPELITNGDFATDSDWTAGYGASQSDITISNGELSFISSAAYGFAEQLINVTSGKIYKITADIKSFSGTMRLFSSSANDSKTINSTGIITNYLTPIDATTLIGFSAGNDIGASVVCNSISCVEVGQDWSFVGEAELTEQGARIYSSSGGQSYITQNILTNTKNYKITYDIVDNTQGSLKLSNVNGLSDYPIPSTVGSHTVYFTANNNILFIYRNFGATDVTIDNISVIEITDDTNLPRIDYSPYSGAGTCGHWLFEPQSTQTATYSNDFTQGDIFGSSSNPLVAETVLTSQQATSPDGTNNAWKMVDSNDGVTGQTGFNYFSTTVIANNYNTISYFVKKQGSNNFVYLANNGFDAGGNGNTFFDIQNGTLGDVAPNHTANIENYGNGWYRISITMQATTDIVGAFSLRLATSNGAVNILRDGTNGVYFFGVQAESDASRQFMTSYIPTEGSIKTRLRDAAFGAGSSDLISSTEGVLYLEVAALTSINNYESISLSDGGTQNRIRFQFLNTLNRGAIQVQVGSVNQMYSTIDFTDITDFNKVAIKYKQNDFSVWLNGVKIFTNTSGTIPTLNQLNFNSGSNFNHFFGKTKCVAVFKEALTDDELECLTSDETSFSSFNALALANNYTII